MKKLIITFLVMLLGSATFAFEVVNEPADIALQRLLNGNDRFSCYKMSHPNISKHRRNMLINGQHPYAVIITCADSRVAPEVIFDQGLGDIFVIRNAGNVSDDHVLGSVEYAVHHLGVNLVMVLGHESCGAVGAAMKPETDTYGIETIKDSILPAVKKCQKDGKYSYENVIRANAKLVADELSKSDDLKEYSKHHNIKIVPAYYHIGTGKVDVIEDSDE